MPPKDVERMANSVDPDQNLHCLLRHTCPNIKIFTVDSVRVYVYTSMFLHQFSKNNFCDFLYASLDLKGLC